MVFADEFWKLLNRVGAAVPPSRVEEDVYTASNNTTTVTKFAYSIASELHRARGSADGTANVWADLNGNNQLLMRRFYLEDLGSVFARMDSSGNVAWYLPDQLGSIRGVMNNSGSLTDQINYDAWGNILSESSPSNGDRYKFDGGEYSSITGLDHFGARYYDPAVGRWYGQDPLGFGAGDPNLSRYVFNDPTNESDPSGLCWFRRRHCRPGPWYTPHPGPSSRPAPQPGPVSTTVLRPPSPSIVSWDGSNLSISTVGNLDGKNHPVPTIIDDFARIPVGAGKVVVTAGKITSKITIPNADFWEGMGARFGLGAYAGAYDIAKKKVHDLIAAFEKAFPTTYESEPPKGTYYEWQFVREEKPTWVLEGSEAEVDWEIRFQITIKWYRLKNWRKK